MGLAKLVVGVTIIGAVGLVASWLAGSVMVAGHHSTVRQAVAPSRDMFLATPDHLRIGATFTPGRDAASPAVLLLHGVGASRESVARNAAWLANLGYATLAIDFRGHGQSDIAARTFGIREAVDARTAFDWLKRKQNGAPVAIIGISLGGAASLIGDAGPIAADALVLQAVYPDIRRAIRNRIAGRLSVGVGYLLEPLLSSQSRLRFGVWPSRLSPIEALSRFRGPVLVIGGMQDESTPPDESRAMLAALKGHGELWLVPSGDHAEICDLSTEAYRRRLAAFLAKAIPHG